MALSFLTSPQQMTFVNSTTHHVVGAHELNAGDGYDVFFTIQNDEVSETLASEYSVHVTHSPFGINSLGDAAGIIQPVSVDIAPKGPGGNGTATLHFHFNATENGHCCLLAQINQPAATTICPPLNQNLDVYDTTAVVGHSSPYGFFVYWDITQRVKLILTEKSIDSDGTIEAGLHSGDASWNPSFNIPATPGLIIIPVSATEVHLEKSAGAGFTSIMGFVNVSPMVTPADIKGHMFSIVGTDIATGNYVGEADIQIINATSGPYIAPEPYLGGGYQSPDIKLFDPITNMPVTIGGINPADPWDTQLRHDSFYPMSAVIHNSSGTPAVNTIVQFWWFDGGVGTMGHHLGTATVTVPANSSFEIKSPNPFPSAPLHHHRCAAVSIFNAQAAAPQINATDSAMVPDPGSFSWQHERSAWRNTDSSLYNLGDLWHFPLALTKVFEKDPGGPVELKLETLHVPLEWNNRDEAMHIRQTLNAAGVGNEKPLYLMPVLQAKLAKIDLKTSVKMKKDVIKSNSERNIHTIDMGKEKHIPFELHGEIPKSAKSGDVILVKITANYPKTDRMTARSVEFLKIMHVTDQNRPK